MCAGSVDRRVVKIGCIHLEDAVPLTVGQEWSGWAAQLETAAKRVEASQSELYRLAAGGTAVGSGLNAPHNFGPDIAAEVASLTGRPFVTAPNKIEARGGLDGIVAASATLRGLAVPLIKIANDIRWLGSGPRCRIAELKLPANEPGNSIMPGKVNPTQCEAMVMGAFKSSVTTPRSRSRARRETSNSTPCGRSSSITCCIPRRSSVTRARS